MSRQAVSQGAVARGAATVLLLGASALPAAAGTVVATGAELVRAGTTVSTVLPDGTAVSSVEMWLACSIPPPAATDLVAYSVAFRGCSVSSYASAASVVAPGDPVLPFGALDVATAAQCLARRAVVFVDPLSGLRYCLPWSACPELAPEIVGGGPVCAGTGVTLEVLGNWEDQLWSPGGETTAQIVVSPWVTTAYSVTVWDSEHCEGSAWIEVVVLPPPEPEIYGLNGICLGDTTVLDAGPGWTSYSWRPGGETTRTITIAPQTTTTYAVAVTDDAGCAGVSDPHAVTVVICEEPLFADGFETGDTDRWSAVIGG